MTHCVNQSQFSFSRILVQITVEPNSAKSNSLVSILLFTNTGLDQRVQSLYKLVMTSQFSFSRILVQIYLNILQAELLWGLNSPFHEYWFRLAKRYVSGNLTAVSILLFTNTGLDSLRFFCCSLDLPPSQFSFSRILVQIKETMT